MTDRRRIEYVTTMDSKGFNQGATGLMGKIEQIGQKFGMSEGFMRGATGAIAAFGSAFAAQNIGQFVLDGLNLAASAAEVDSKFQAVYGSAEDLKQKLIEWGDKAGVTETDAYDLAASFGNLALAQGTSYDATVDLVEKVADLAGDLASFNDADPEQVFEDLNKALLTTEREGMKKYGIAISETEVKHRALNLAVADGRTEASQADRVMAAYQIAVEQAGKAVGDLDRTQDSAKNQTRQFKASVEELKRSIGDELLPAFQDLVTYGNDWLIPVLKDIGDTMAQDNVRDSETWLDALKKTAEWAINPAAGFVGAIGQLKDAITGADGLGKSFEKGGQSVGTFESDIRGTDEYIRPTVAGWQQQWADMRREMGLPIKVAKPDSSALGELSRQIIAAKLEFLELRDLLGGGLPGIGGKAISDAKSTWDQINGGPL